MVGRPPSELRFKSANFWPSAIIHSWFIELLPDHTKAAPKHRKSITFPLRGSPPPAQLRAAAFALPTPPLGGSDRLVMGEACFRRLGQSRGTGISLRKEGVIGLLLDHCARFGKYAKVFANGRLVGVRSGRCRSRLASRVGIRRYFWTGHVARTVCSAGKLCGCGFRLLPARRL